MLCKHLIALHFQKLIDKTRVTCIKWLPGSPNHFLVSFSSGHMYVINEESPSGTTPPHYQPFKHGEGYSVHTCKTKYNRNPVYRWVVGESAINEFAFSPCGKYLAVVSDDGYLRVFDYHTMDLIGTMRSYFGALLCVGWSPDSKYLVTGGQDDLVSVWSMQEKRVMCRGKAHRSWINVVAFDPYTTKFGDPDGFDFSGSDEDFQTSQRPDEAVSTRDLSRVSIRSTTSVTSHTEIRTNYRFGSVGQDTQLCLWDLTEDILSQPMGRHRTSTVLTTPPMLSNFNANNVASGSASANSISPRGGDATLNADITLPRNSTSSKANHNSSFTQKFATLALGERSHKDGKDHKRNFSLGSKSGDKLPAVKAHHARQVDDSVRLLGTTHCPRLDEVPMLEPMVCKKVAHERLTSLVFREDCIVTACRDGVIYTWARPGKAVRTYTV